MMMYAGNVVGPTGPELVADVGKRTNSISKIGRSPIMPTKYCEREVMQRTIKEAAVHRAIWTVVFPRPVCIEQSHDDALCAVLNGRVTDLHLVYPLGHRIVVHLFDLILVHYRFDHEFGPVAVYFGR